MLPRYLDFSISTMEPAENAQTEKTLPVQRLLLGAIDPAGTPGAAKAAARQEGAP